MSCGRKCAPRWRTPSSSTFRPLELELLASLLGHDIAMTGIAVGHRHAFQQQEFDGMRAVEFSRETNLFLDQKLPAPVLFEFTLLEELDQSRLLRQHLVLLNWHAGDDAFRIDLDDAAGREASEFAFHVARSATHNDVPRVALDLELA